MNIIKYIHCSCLFSAISPKAQSTLHAHTQYGGWNCSTCRKPLMVSPISRCHIKREVFESWDMNPWHQILTVMVPSTLVTTPPSVLVDNVSDNLLQNSCFNHSSEWKNKTELNFKNIIYETNKVILFFILALNILEEAHQLFLC